MLRKRGKYWHVQLKVNGKPWNRSTGETNLARARKVERDILARAQLLRERLHELPSLDAAVVREVARIEADVSTRAADRADYCFDAFQRWIKKDIPLERIDTAMLEAFQRDRLKKASLSTVNKELCVMVRLLRLNGFAVNKPKAKPGRATEQREFSEDELKLFFGHCTEDQKTLFLTMLATGARPAELIPSPRSGHVALLKNEVDTGRLTILIRSAKAMPGRKGKARTVKVAEELMARLTVQAGKTKGHHVFPKAQNLFRTFNGILGKAGIDKLDPLGRKLTAHSFRHTFATRMAQAIGGNPFLLKEILGHTQITTTDRYCHMSGATPAVEVGGYLGATPGMDVNGGCQKQERRLQSRLAS